MEHYVSYDKRTRAIIDFFPIDTPEQLKAKIAGLWSQTIAQEILITLSIHDELSTANLQKAIGHSLSTLHENIRRLEDAGIITATMSYKENKQKILRTNVIFITDNPKDTQRFNRFFQGLWIDNTSTNNILRFLEKNPSKYFTAEEIARSTNLALSDVKILLSNLESPITRGFSSFSRSVPFEKKVLYRATQEQRHQKGKT